MRIFTEVGNRVALYCTGVGKAILAVLPSEQTRALIGETALVAHTPTTITDPDALDAEIALIRARGYALDEGEMEVGVRCVAVGMPGAVPMAVSVSGPAARMTDDLVATAVSALRAASTELGRHLA
jgi:IclR family acetate operon transcriptional repressor